jgi:Ion channel
MNDGHDRHSTLTPRRGMPFRERVRTAEAYGILLLLIVSLLIVTALVGPSDSGRLAVLAIQGGVLLFALWTARAERRLLRIALIVVPLAITIVAFISGDGTDAGRAVVTSVGAALALCAIVAIARQVVSHPKVDAVTILAALCTYLLIGLFFASLYATVGTLDGGSFFVQATATTPVDFLYFSFVTLTTLGYGDLTPAGDVGRMLAVTEALLGQLYLVTVVALVIGNVGVQRNRD